MLTLNKDTDTVGIKETWWQEGNGMWKSQGTTLSSYFDYSEVKCEIFTLSTQIIVDFEML